MMMRSTAVHAVFAHKYIGSHPHHPHPSRLASHPRTIPVTPHRPHLTDSLENDYVQRILLHPLIRERRRSTPVLKFIDDNYMVIESFLQESFRRKQSLSASDIADALDMDYGDVRETLARMIKEGKLGVK